MGPENYTQPDDDEACDPSDTGLATVDAVLLARAAKTLKEVETVLVSTTSQTRTEINDILAVNDNLGGIGLLIDQVQFARDYLTLKTN